MTRNVSLKVAGVDLAGSPQRATGFCLLSSRRATRVATLGSDDEILDRIRADRPDLVIIDAPLFLPRGRASLEQRGPPHLRECDRELLRAGIRFFPLSLGPMRMLTARGMRLRGELEAEGRVVCEGYPGASQDIMGWPRKQAGRARLQRALLEFGFRGAIAERPLIHDELDAISCAWAGWLHLRGESWVLGDPQEGIMVLPRPRRGSRFLRRGPRPRMVAPSHVQAPERKLGAG
ncbi:MAG: DUF429 domain-containing protein [Thermoplasmata archaeon]|nr:DUF429 domain-containing protein [Thermoplasmata archaeon]